MNNIKIVLDALGTDNQLEEIILGAINSVNNFQDLELRICGPEKDINEILKKYNCLSERVIIINSTEVISNSDNPINAIRQKKDSSLVKAYDILNQNEDYQGLVSAGSTGAILCGGIMKLNRINKCRPALAAVLPNGDKGFFCLVDCGANADCKSEHLVDFAKMGCCYMKSLFNINNPKVGLISNGSEDKKGNELTKEVFNLLKKSDLNFVGNIEGTEILSGKFDVLVCDGFSGNIVLKNIEGTAKTIIKEMLLTAKGTNDENEKKYIESMIKKLMTKYDFNSLGGATLLGFDKVIVKGHGAATTRTIEHIISQAYQLINNNIIDQIKDML